MQHLTVTFSDLGELASFLGSDKVLEAVADARSVLAQVYTGICDETWIEQVVGQVGNNRDKVVVVGATTFGEIEAGQALSKSTVVSLICFESARLTAIALPCKWGDEVIAAQQVALALHDIHEPVKGVLLLATTLSVNCNVLLAQLFADAPEIPVFGGGAGDNGAHEQTFVFSGDGSISSGLVAVALHGESLDILRRGYLGWERMGRPMVVTKVERFTLHTINDRPAFEMYRRYLGITEDEDFFLNAMEFPFMVERGGQVVARVPHAVHTDGAIDFVADLVEGETIEFGYAHVDAILMNASATVEAVRRFEPEAISIYSGGIRRFVMQQDVGLELAPFEAIAPTAGFFSYGEFFSFDTHSPLLNARLVIVGMRERPRGKVFADDTSDAHHRESAKDTATDVYAPNHMRVLSKLQHFMRAVTDELEEANARLASLADHDYLTGLWNRRVLSSQLENEMERCRRHGRGCSLIFADIDHFKTLNDDYGHSAGDRVLMAFANLLTANARASDCVCRYGGEEFVVLLTEMSGSQARAIAERIRGQVQQLTLKHNHEQLPQVTVSLGVAYFPDDAKTPDDLLIVADNALYKAKRTGRNRVCMASSEVSS